MEEMCVNKKKFSAMFVLEFLLLLKMTSWETLMTYVESCFSTYSLFTERAQLNREANICFNKQMKIQIDNDCFFIEL